jgi:hypothetical protein
MIYKKQYIDFCSKNRGIKLFNNPNWLDIVSNEEWYVIPIEVNNKTLGLLPFVKRGFLLNFSILPKITQFLSPIILDYKFFKLNEKEFYFDLSKKLNKLIFFRLSWLNDDIYNIEILKKFFSVHLSKSYQISKSKKKYSENALRWLKKSRVNNLIIKEEFDHEKFYFNYCKNLKNRGLNNYYKKKFFLDFLNSIKKINIGKVFIVENKKKQFQSGAVIVWDNFKVYMIILTTNHEFKQTGGSYLLIDFLVNYSLDNNKSFDFEGGNIKSIGNFYSNFTKEKGEIIELSKKNTLFNFFSQDSLDSQ